MILVLFLVFLPACSGKSSDNYYGDEVNSDTLVICMDCLSTVSTADSYELEKELDQLMQEIKRACGIEKIAFEIIPGTGAERTTVLQRLRTEIMAGGGPDVFLMRTRTGSYEFGYDDALFNFPEKNMEAGLFLPLDEYMENSTQFTDWSAQTQVILDAGQNDEGQLIVPLTYTFPILVYPEDEITIPYTTELTMQEILEDPESTALGAVLYSDLSRSDEQGERNIRTSGIYYVLGKFADFEKEELLFTEDELYEVIVTMNSLHDAIEENELQYLETQAGYFDLIYQIGIPYFETDMALVPTYSMDGGVTASILSYAAVNRNTRLPQKAFSVIDYLMCEESQRTGLLYDSFFSGGLPLQHDLGSAEKSLRANSNPERSLDAPYFEDLLVIKEQITAVNFQNKLDYELLLLMREYQDCGMVSREDVAEAYTKMKRMIGE